MDLTEFRQNYNSRKIISDIISNIPFIAVHLGALSVLFVSFSWWSVALCLSLYVVRMFGITAGFHRYFSHRTFKTSRTFQFLLGTLATSAAQRGPLWWAAHHRHHHRHSDTDHDVHSPVTQGFFWSHIGWIVSSYSSPTMYHEVKDLTKFKELVILNKFHQVIPFCLGVLLFVSGYYLGNLFPGTGITGGSFLAWGFFMSTTLLYHGTFSINSLSHVFGSKRFKTEDESRNNFWLALITLGEGWHNNHHRYPASERQGFYWWEVDFAHMALWLLSKCHIVWDLKTPPEAIYEEAKARRESMEQAA